MAKGKGGNTTKKAAYVSKGEVGVNRMVLKEMRRERRTGLVRLMNQRAAWRAGKRVVLTVPNPNKNDRRAPFVKVDARSVWGDPREQEGAPQMA